MKKTLIVFLMGILSITAWGQVAREDVALIDDVKVVTLDGGKQILAAKNGLSLYTFDTDQASGESRCFGGCLRVWPALVTESKQVEAPFGITEREPGVFQLMLNDEPLYFFFRDSKEGDILGDGLQGVWHLIEVK
ncbi:MAG: hypothetical protein NXH75_12745 [Halobacteriovoraceae bacterium]|nr:hypothetical protein [Halobacteriovoraceae bacterium]